ncbi:MAG: DUF445 domain-containing protein [Pseudomonadota bacterium]|jgi:uncharacterized membrane protein YheB (UPF0754 family)
MIFRSDIWFLVSIPIVSALIGYVTNYIAVAMLFRPHRPVSVLGVKLQGLVPRRQREIAQSLGAMIERDLFSHEDIQQALKSVETAEEASLFLNEQIDLFVQKLAGQNPMVGMFMQGPLLDQVKGLLREQMSERFPSLLERIVQRAEDKLDVSEIVRAKVEAFDLTKLEAIIHEVSARELKTIEVLGGVLGFIVGLAQVALMVAAG